MPENPITAYFLPVSSNLHRRSQARQRPSPSKRARQVDESETSRQSSRKKTKIPNKDLKGKREHISSISRKAPLFSHWSTTPTEQLIQSIVEIEDTPPSSPVKPVSPRHATPPSSPLPELTPSPEIELPSFPCLPPIHNLIELKRPGPNTSSEPEPTSSHRRQVESELIPSSQTQILDSLFNYDTASPTCTLETPLANIPLHSHEPAVSYPESTLSSQSCLIPSDSDDFIASSQSQHMSLPIDPEFELVPSSQTQEIFHSQRTGLYSFQEGEPESRLSLADVPEDYYQTISQFRMSSPSEEPEFRVAASGSQLVSSQASEPGRDDELASYESLPDVVKELQGMFGETYESYPPDFPMSLR